MYLKSLVLKGFKSFADRSVLRLEPGMTVVVGPNGSGKSNISDAVLWVLGEQSAKHLRGQAMEDVIFAGSSARKAVGLAEVDLVLDNSDGTLPLDFTEVVITRRMYRSGESEYLINGTQTRLMDVLDILNDSGLGRDTHSIISQGALQDILHARPEERRVLIEEAAGILKHKKRKERAGRKLKGMDAALTRVHDIQGEIDRQLRPLARQASRAKQHEDLSEELKSLELVLAVDDLRALQGEWEAVEKAEREADANTSISRLKLEQASSELEKYQRLLEEKGLFVGDLAELRSRCRQYAERIDALMSLLDEKDRNAATRLSELEQTARRAEDGKHEASVLLASCKQEAAEASAQLSELQSQLEDADEQAAQVAEKRRQADDEASELSAQVRRCEKAIDACVLEAAKAEEALSSASVKDSLFEQRQEQITESMEKATQSLEANRVALGKLEDKLAALREETRRASNNVDEGAGRLNDAREKLDAARELCNFLHAERQALVEVDRAFDDASPLLSWSLNNKERLGGVVSAVSELFSAPVELEGLVEHLLGADMYGLLMDSPESAGSLAAQLLASGISGGEISLVSLEGQKLQRHPADTGMPLLEQLTYDKANERVAQVLLGDVYVVDTIEEAIEASQKDKSASRFVTRQGVVAWPGGKLTLGTKVADAQGVLARKRRLNALSVEEPQALDACEKAQEAVGKAEVELQKMRDESLALSQSLAQVEGQARSLREEGGRLDQTIVNMRAELDQVSQSRMRLAEGNAEALAASAEISERRQSLEAEKSAFADKLKASEEDRHRLAAQDDACRRTLSATKVELATIRERVRHLTTRSERLSEELSGFGESLTDAEKGRVRLEAIRLRIGPLRRALAELAGGIEKSSATLRDQAQLEQAGTGDLRDTIEKARSKVSAAQKDLDNSQEKLTGVRIEKGRLEVMVEQAIKSITEDHGAILDVALEIPAPEDRKAAEAKVAKLSRRLSSLGVVNPMAIDEYRSLKERKDFIAAQLEDLEAASKALRRIVSAIDRKLRRCFLDTFEKVDENFREIFTQLFPGGKGYLQLSDPSAPDETGVEVCAQPRGKAVRKQTLLSGGEQSLIAMALMFSVYKVRSTPFYILDEVEAALDDTNLRRLLAYLDSIRASTQFIIISHQRRTMEMADLLYGVSMRGDGVSKLVSQRLDQAVRLARKPEEHVDVEEFSGADTGDRDAGNV